MAKITRHHLEFENEIDYELIGICSHVGDYRLVWNLNESLDLKLEKSPELFVITGKKGQAVSEHPFYVMHHEQERWSLYLIKNKSEGKFLIPEKQQIDYFLFICNNYTLETDRWVEQLREIPNVVAAYGFDPEDFASAQQIVFE
ncbi:MAG: hypothetical protein K0R65_1437 [Crocinitomicaceae bacterium]|jgi:hypothetical protein|nr:hypothetical protein [Crocinitomicaceae bacterium]